MMSCDKNCEIFCVLAMLLIYSSAAAFSTLINGGHVTVMIISLQLIYKNSWFVIEVVQITELSLPKNILNNSNSVIISLFEKCCASEIFVVVGHLASFSILFTFSFIQRMLFKSIFYSIYIYILIFHNYLNSLLWHCYIKK